MSLRTDIHVAFEAIAPPTGGMAERVVDMVRREARTKNGRNRLMVRMRPPLTLVAVFVTIALAAAALVGGQIIHAWQAQHATVPAGDTLQSQVVQLESRPVVLPSFKTHADCKGDLGSGPVFAQLVLNGAGPGGRWTNNSFVYSDESLYADSAIAGPILVRARDVVTNQPVFFVGQYAAGQTVGHDVQDGSKVVQRSELVLTADNSSRTPSGHRYHWEFLAGMPYTWSGSTAWQIDGLDFTEIVVVC